MKKVLFSIVLFISLGFVGDLCAQKQITAQERLFVKVEGLSGYTWAHHISINYLLDAVPYGGAVYVGLRSVGKYLWEHSLRFPNYGLGFQISQLGGKVLGNSYSMFLFLNPYILKYRNFQWNYSLNAGLGYLDNPYDPKNNPLNIVNGSAINSFLKVSSEIQYTFAKSHIIGFKGGLFHLSNGNSALPNWGTNVLYGALNYTYLFGNPDNKKVYSFKEEFTKNTRITLYGGGGIKEEPPIDDIKFAVVDIHLNIWRTFRPAHSFGGGITTFFDESSAKVKWRRKYDYLLSKKNYKNNIDNWSLGAQVGYMLNLHPFYFSLEFGVYLLSPIKDDVYNRWFLEYLLTKNLRVYAGLKSRFGKADFVTMGLGYDIFKKKD